jgi:DNA processing protein
MASIDDETFALLKLSTCEGIGNESIHRLLQRFESARAALDAGRQNLLEVEGVGETLARRITSGPDMNRIERELDLMERARTRLVAIGSENYPVPLTHLGTSAPPLIRVRGEIQRRDMLSVAIVGSRNCTHYGRSQSRRFAMSLTGMGFSIVSGLARGIDSEAHRGAIQAKGRTIALLGCGLARIDSLEDPELALSVCENGALVSELPMDAPPLPRHFPPRNRLISGLSLGVVVVQASRKSGSLITARWAGEQGKSVFAIPGQVDSSASHGCHQLIRDGAVLVETPREVLDELGPISEPLPAPSGEDKQETQDADEASYAVPLTDRQKSVLELIGAEPCQIDAIIDQTGMAPSLVSSTLLTLEIRGIIRRLPGQSYVRD